MSTTRGTITRARRQAVITTALDRATAALRGLATGRTPTAEAGFVALRYCRAVGIPTAAVDDASLAFLASDSTRVLPIEDIDDWLCKHASATAAVTAIARAGAR